MGLGDGIVGGSGLGDGISSDSGQSNGMNGDPTGGGNGYSGTGSTTDRGVTEGLAAGKGPMGADTAYGPDDSDYGYTDSFAEKALGALWGATKEAVAYGITQNEFAKAVEAGLNIIGFDVDFKDEVANFMDKGFTRDEAASQVASDIKGQLSESDVDDGTRDEILSNLDKALDFSEVDDPMSNPDSYEFFTNQLFNTDEGKAILNDMYNGSTNLAKENYETLKETTQEQNGLLDDLIDQSKTGTGLFSPFEFSFMGQEVSFVPRAKRAQAAQEASMGQSMVGNEANLLQAALGIDALDQKWSIAKMQDANTDEAQQFREEASEPGILDWIKGIGSLF